MPRAAYSKRFICTAGLAGRGDSVIVPAGRVYIVREVTIYCSDFANTAIFFEDDTTGAALIRATVPSVEGLWFGFYGALVFEPGEGFHFQVNNAIGESADVYAGGYDLSLDGL
jgi:hypothetical protein